MLGILATLLICHCIYSALRWRRFLQGNSQPIQYLPLDIIIEALFGLILACLSIAAHAKKLKNIHTFEQAYSYDKALERKNFRDYSGERGQILQEILKKRLQITQFNVPV